MARNTSDSIEEYIKELLGQSGIAERFNVRTLAILFKLYRVRLTMLLRHVLQRVVVISLRVSVVVAVIFVSSRSDSLINITESMLYFKT